MLRKTLIKNKTGSDSIRWRLHEPLRIEAFSDAVIAFALTLIVVSLEVPKTFEELLHNMRGFFGFAICFTFLALIWHDQYIFFRRFGLQDTRTIFYNLVLLFVVLLFVYPLKFLFSFLTEGNDFVKEDGTVLHKFTHDEQVSQLMIVYSTGYLVINIIFTLMYKHALGKKHLLQLSPLEVYNTRSQIFNYYGQTGITILSLVLAFLGTRFGGLLSFFAGIIYSLIGPVTWIIRSLRNKKISRLFTPDEINEVSNEVVMVKEKNVVE